MLRAFEMQDTRALWDLFDVVSQGEGTDAGAKHNDCEAIKCLMENPDSLHDKCCSYQITSEKCEHLLREINISWLITVSRVS